MGDTSPFEQKGSLVLSEVRDTNERLRRLIADFEPDRLDGDVARDLVEAAAEGERLFGAIKALAARRVAATRSWKRAGCFRNAASWMAAVSGTTVGQAASTLETAQRLHALPNTEAALRAGELSGVQAEAIAAAASADPHSEQKLLESAQVDGVKGLRSKCAEVRAAAYRDENERHEGIHERRSLRHWTDADGAGRIDVCGPVDATARIMAALEPFERELFKTARAAKQPERPDAIAFDALVAMCEASGTGAGASPSQTVVVVRVDHSAFVRGHTEPGEVCEIAGVGPIPVSVAQRLADDAFLKALIVDGTDVRAVSHLGEGIPARLRTAVEDMYPECCIQGCHLNRNLEIDHNVPREEHGPTELWNLHRLCRFHHRYKHAHKLRLEGKGTNQRFVPARPPSSPP